MFRVKINVVSDKRCNKIVTMIVTFLNAEGGCSLQVGTFNDNLLKLIFGIDYLTAKGHKYS